MKKRIATISMIALATVLLTAIGYSIVTIFPSLSRPLKDADTHYASATASIQSIQDLRLQVETSTELLVDGQVYTERSQQTLLFNRLNTDSLTVSVDETLTVGSHETMITELYCDDMVYITMQGSSFSGNCSAEEFLERHIPAVLLDHTLYKSIKGEIKRGTAVLTFSQATAAEAWALPEGAEYIRSNGTAWLTEDDVLIRSQYTITYRYSDVTVTVLYDVRVDADIGTPVTIPANTENYLLLDAPYTPRLLEIATGYLTQSSSITAEYDEYIRCEAFGDERTREISINMDSADAWSARLETAITLLNSSRQDDIMHLTQTETFIDGVHTVSIDGSEPEADATITEEALRSYCQELLLGTIILPQYITAASYEELDDTYRIVYTASEDFARSVCAYTCQTLYQNPAVLDSMAEEYATDYIQCCLEISKSTGLPCSAKISFSGSYTIHGLQYQLIYQADQSYSLPSKTAQNTIREPLT